MKKIIQKYGNAHVIRLNSQEMLIYNLAEGDFVDLEINKIAKPKYSYQKIVKEKKK